MSVMDYLDTQRKGNFSVTFTGTKFYALDPRPEEIHKEDIAHHLANQCRYGGAVRKPYSVAEHCVRASEMIDPAFAFPMLMHDTSETWLVDIPRPIKYLDEFSAYTVIEDGIMEVVAEKYGFNWPMDPEVKEVDDAILVQEWKSLMPLTEDLILNDGFFQTVADYDGPLITPWSFEEAEERFLNRFNELTKEDK